MNSENKYKRLTASGQIAAKAGYIRALTVSAVGTVTAGTLTLYDNTAGSGTVIWAGIIQVGLSPTTIILDAQTSTGLYLDFGTSANVAATASYRDF